MRIADRAGVDAYRRLRREVFVGEQQIFDGSDLDDLDADPETLILVAVDGPGAVVGGVRVAPTGGDPLGGWWSGSRLVVARQGRGTRATGAALVRAACALVEAQGALRFDAVVQPQALRFFERLGWRALGEASVAGRPHVSMRWPIGRAQVLADATKSRLGEVLEGLGAGGSGWVGDDAAPLEGTDLLVSCDSIIPAMVESDPEWAGWCGVLVSVNDLAAMGAEPIALLDALSVPGIDAAKRVMRGLRAAAAAYGVPIVGGHTALGVRPALSVTAIGRAPYAVPGGGGRPGDTVHLVADLAGGWRPRYEGAQWDSTSGRSAVDLRVMVGAIGRDRPVAAKDVSMAGVIGTLGMLAEASGCGAELDVASVPRPPGVSLGDWLTCFPGFAMISAHRGDATRPGGVEGLPPFVAGADCGRLVEGTGVSLVWPDGERTVVIASSVSGLGPA